VSEHFLTAHQDYKDHSVPFTIIGALLPRANVKLSGQTDHMTRFPPQNFFQQP